MFAEMWLLLVGYTFFFWILIYLQEEKAKKTLSLLKLESTQNRLFANFLHDESHTQFDKEELTMFIHGMYNKRKTLFSIFFAEVITQELAQEISALIIKRSCENKFLIQLGIPALDDLYELSEESIIG